MSSAKPDARLAIARHAAALFLAHGVAGTSGDDIAAAAGLSTRTIWRHFRNKESCVEPLFLISTLRFSAQLRQWPRHLPIEAYLAQCFDIDKRPPEDVADDVLVARLVARLPAEPSLRAVWLLAGHQGEQDMVDIIRTRLDGTVSTFDAQLCAATVMAALRVVDETISLAAIEQGQHFTMDQIVEQMARAMRAASTLPICDPVAPQVFGQPATPVRAARKR